MTSNLPVFAAYTASFSVLLPLLLLIKKKENLKDEVLSVLAAFLSLSALTDLACYLVNKFLHQPTVILSNIEFVLECVLLSIVYARLFDRHHKIVYSALAFFVTFFLINSLCWQDINTYQSMTRILGGLIFVAFSVLYYFQLMRDLPANNLLHYGPYWLVLGVFSSFMLNVYFYTLSTYVLTELDKENRLLFWMLHSFNEIARNTLFAIAVFQGNKRFDSATFSRS